MVLSTLLLAAEAVAEKPANPILPVANELFWGAVCFFGAVGPHEVRAAQADRRRPCRQRAAKVRDDLEQAERADARARERHRAVRARACRAPRPRPSGIIEDARAEADDQRNRVIAAGRGRGRRSLRSGGRADEVADAKADAMAELRGGVAAHRRRCRIGRRAEAARSAAARCRSSRTTSTGPARRADLEPARTQTERTTCRNRCYSPPSDEPNGFLLPHDINEVIWGTIAFLIVLGLLIWKSAARPSRAAWNGRTERLSKELDDAAAAKAEAQTKLADVQHRIADAGNERQRILDEAAQTAATLAQDRSCRPRPTPGRGRAGAPGPPPTSRPRRARPSPTCRPTPQRWRSERPRRS